LGIFDDLNYFSEIENRISALPSNKERGDAFEVFAEVYLATQKINEAREVWPFESIPNEQRTLLALDTGRDMGVDGTYQTHAGELRAYQVKFRSHRPALTWDELSTFMGLTDQVSQRVLFTNCENLHPLMSDRRSFVAIRGSDLDRLTREDFAAMRQWLQDGHVKPTRKKPDLDHAHQQEALAAIANELNDSDRATVVMACGTGKSLVALWAAEQRDSRNLLVLLPSLALVRQLLHEWMRETSWEKLAYLCVCSDPSVENGNDGLIVHQPDLDFPVMTESATVGRFLDKPFDGVKVVFSTYQSAHVVAEGMPIGMDGAKKPFDLAIFDEAHKTATRSGTHFSFALMDENLPIHKRLFFTATPRHYDIRKKDKEGDNTLVYSMDRPEIYGRVAYSLGFAEAARRGIICDYKVVISVVTSEMLNDHALKHGEVIVAGDEVKARQVALQIALQKAVEKYGVSRIFTFHGTVAAARSFTSGDGEGIRHHLGGFKTLHVSGAMPTSRRDDIMTEFRQAKRAVISNARCLTEGVDVPAVDMVAFMSPRKSKVDIVQATGRAMRKSQDTGKQIGYVMVPVFLDIPNSEAVEDAMLRTDFTDVWDVLSAMKEQDEVLTDVIRELREQRGRTGGYDDSRFHERVEILGPSLTLDAMRQFITTACLDKLGVTWDERFGELIKFKERFGDCNVPQLDAEYEQLANWVSNQRSLRKVKKISPQRIARLESIGFHWNMLDAFWENRFSELVNFQQQKGHCRVPFDWPENKKLSLWVGTQRQDKKKGKLDSEKERRLQEIGFDWNPAEFAWEKNFVTLVKFFQQGGHLDVPEKWSDAPGLRRWVNKQREDYKRGKLNAVQIERMDDLGFIWAPLDESWNARFGRLADFKNRHGHCDVRERDDVRLAEWVNDLRKRGKTSLPQERTEALDTLGFDWDPCLERDWEEMFAALVEYARVQGDCNVPPEWPEQLKLGRWVSTQRKEKKNGRLSERRITRLNAIGFVWVSFAAKWDKSYQQLVEYKNTYAHCNVPQKWKENPTLGKWVSDQRKKWRDKNIGQEKIDLLNALGFVWQPKTS